MTTDLFDAVSVRLKAIFTAHAALELEAEVIVRHVERKAALLRQAAKLEEEGLKDLAAELREHAGGLDPRRPAETAVPMLPQTPNVAQESNGTTPAVNGIAVPTAEATVNGTPQVAATIAEPPKPTAVNSTVPDSKHAATSLPEAIPAEPTAEASIGRSRKKSR